MTMCDKELLVSYLYDELQGPERQAFEQHVEACSACSGELRALRGTRTHLSSWAPVEPDLSFEIVRRPEARPSRLHWTSSRGAWGLAAAAVLVLAAAAGIANVEVRKGSDGFVVRTGWSRGVADPNASGVQAANAAASRDDLAAMERRLAELETALAARPAGVVTASARSETSRAAEEQLLQRMRQMLAESETRTEREFAQRLIAGMREVQASHTNDLISLQQTLNQNQGAINDEVFRQREEMKNFYRLVGTQSQR